MTKSGRIAGGLMVLIGSALQFYTTFLYFLIFLGFSKTIITLIPLLLSVMMAIMGIIGGILLLRDKSAGGVLSLIVGAFIIVGSFILLPVNSSFSVQLAGHINGWYIDPVLLIIGSIIGLAVGSEL